MIPHNKPTLGMEEEEAAIRVLRTDWIAQGAEVEAFENEFCDFIGLAHGHAVAVSSGTAALFLALWVLGAKCKKIAIPVYSCSALRHAVAMAGGIEVLIDVGINSPNIDSYKLIESRAKIAIIPHMYGLPVDFQQIESENVLIIEDCAQALGAKIADKHVGLFGKLGVFSFYATKLITTGGYGGMVVSQDKSLINSIRDYREFDLRHDKLPRFNFKMGDIQAAIGRVQLRKLQLFLKLRDEIFIRYKEAGLNLLDIHEKDKGHLKPVRYRAVMLTTNPLNLIKKLSSIGVSAIAPIEDWELLGDGNFFPNAFKLSKMTVSLPIYPSLSENEVDLIIKGVLSK